MGWVRPRAGLVACVLSALSLGGCVGIPGSGPSAADIRLAATEEYLAPDKGAGVDYVLVDLTAPLLRYLGNGKPQSLRASFGGGHGTAPETPLGVGDIVSVSIFESRAGGLFIPAEAGARSGNFVTLPAQTVDRSGTITVPYAGRIPVAGKNIPAVQKQIESLLAEKAIEPQVVISLVSSTSNEVSVLGDVKSPEVFPLNPAGQRILDVLAEAGGLSGPWNETTVTLERHGRRGTVPVGVILNNPSENIYVAAGDTVFVKLNRRFYLAFGASGRNDRIDFEESDLSLADGIAKAGGLLDERAEPTEVFLYRLVDRRLLEKMGIARGAHVGEQIPVIFRTDLRNPGGLFIAQNFLMADKDILYVSNAGTVDTLKVLSILSAITGNTRAVVDDVRAIKG